ncbi:MAG TPA: NAD(P)H-hydrate dehydratase [Coriobacteriia bacterium]|nr:NAD(P)H-hydrate dehydratase [Coriobacteriia bacterium]
MSLLVVATAPAGVGDVACGPLGRDAQGRLIVDGVALPVCQGSSAMLSAALAVTDHLGVEPPDVLIGGDLGRGEGTRAVYGLLKSEIERTAPPVVAFHYLQPIMALMRETMQWLGPLVESGAVRLVADAGGMYAAKAAGLAPRFDLMTPDVGEVGFLADERATHPAYVSNYLFGADGFDPVELARLAYERDGSARVLLIKGETDRIAVEGVIRETVSEPCVPALEAIGGTGDTITGIASALMAAGFPAFEAAVCAARANRTAGHVMGARPDHRAEDLVAALPAVLAEHLCEWAGACASEA